MIFDDASNFAVWFQFTITTCIAVGTVVFEAHPYDSIECYLVSNVKPSERCCEAGFRIN